MSNLRSPKLCDVCMKRDLTPQRFQGIQDGKKSSEKEPKNSNTHCALRLRSYHKLKRKARPNGDCSFCRLVYHVVTNSGESRVQDDTECLVEWVRADHQASATRQYSRRIRVSWNDTTENCTNAKVQEVYLIYVPPTRAGNPEESSSKEHISKENISKEHISESKPESIASHHIIEEPGCVDRDWNGDIDNWIRRCIQICYSDHPNLPERHEEEPEENRRNEMHFRELVAEPWFLVVDVKNMKLDKLPLHRWYPEPYVALSYRWSTKCHQTNKENLAGRLRDSNSLSLDTMPPTIRHAIELVRRLSLKRGEQEVRYLWIDSLCIVQDDHDPKDWEKNAERMHLVYGNAFLTICAADEHPRYGLRAMYERKSPEEREILPGLRLVVSRSSQYVLPNSEWNKRGWTFQEHLLSRRCLIFAGQRMYFQCRKSNYDDTGIDWSMDWRQSALLTVDEVKRRPIQFYIKAVSLYTGRNLTNPKDILKAFGGVIGLVGFYTCAAVHYGIPSSHFDFAILWRPNEGKGRRPGFPSWSWSGWQHDENPSTGTSVFYPSDVLEGELSNVNRWLLDRTWIEWYIQDECDSEPRPVWSGYNPPYPERAQRVEGRWRGYDGYRTAGRELPELPLESTAIREMEVADAIMASRDSCGRHPRWPTLPRTPSPDTTRPSSFPILRFYTWRCEFFIRYDPEAPTPGNNLARVDVLDHSELWCGTAVVDKSFAESINEQLCTFLALSECRKFTETECPSWTYPIPKNKDDVEWDLFNVMVVQSVPGRSRTVSERRGLGKTTKVAFENGGQTWEEISLA